LERKRVSGEEPVGQQRRFESPRVTDDERVAVEILTRPSLTPPPSDAEAGKQPLIRR
jgi:hypothetical protein